MRKQMGLAMMIAVLAAGSATVYAAPAAVPASCTRNADCPVHDGCTAEELCSYEDCRYGGAEGCYRDHGDHEQYQDCEYYMDHNQNHENHKQENQAGRRTRHHGGCGSRRQRGHC